MWDIGSRAMSDLKKYLLSAKRIIPVIYAATAILIILFSLLLDFTLIQLLAIILFFAVIDFLLILFIGKNRNDELITNNRSKVLSFIISPEK